MTTDGRIPEVVERIPQADRGAVQRISPGDLVELATDVGPEALNTANHDLHVVEA